MKLLETKFQVNVDFGLLSCSSSWYHGSVGRTVAEDLLRAHKEGSFLVRQSESNKQDYSLSLK